MSLHKILTEEVPRQFVPERKSIFSKEKVLQKLHSKKAAHRLENKEEGRSLFMNKDKLKVPHNPFCDPTNITSGFPLFSSFGYIILFVHLGDESLVLLKRSDTACL